jgi:hypothetical protein
MTPAEIFAIFAKLRRGDYTLDELVERTGLARTDIDHALACRFTALRDTGQAGPKWSADKGCHVYPVGGR